MIRVVVLASGTGSLTQALLDAEASGALQARIVAVGTDRPAPVERLAQTARRATFQLPPADFPSRADWDVAMAQAVSLFNPALVVSAGFMRVLGPGFLDRWGRVTINTHPALLPAFPGAHAVRDALAAGVTVTGCTVHRMTLQMDAGPILAQTRVPVEDGDDEASLHERIKAAERTQLVDVINQIADGAIVLA